MSSRIEQLIDEIEEYIDNCKYQPLSNSKIIVNKDEIDDLLRELRQKTPEEIKRYQKIISNKEAILNDAREKAQALINEATEHTTELINEHEIMQQAYAQANEVVQLATRQAQEIVDNATLEANAIKDSIMQYTDQKLAEVEDIIAHAVEVSQTHYSNLVIAHVSRCIHLFCAELFILRMELCTVCLYHVIDPIPSNIIWKQQNARCVKILLSRELEKRLRRAPESFFYRMGNFVSIR